MKKTNKERAKKTKSIQAKAKTNKQNILVLGVIGLIVVIVAGTIFVGVSQALSQESYYVLIDDVTAKSPITTTMVVERTTAKGSAPQNALDYNEIQQGNLYARYALYQGDVVSWSNAGPASDTSLGIPDDWAVTTFNVSSDNAVGGSLGRGEYIDIMMVSEGTSRYAFNNVLILEARTSNQEVTSEEVTEIGEVVQYTVGMPSEEIAILHAAIDEAMDVIVVKAPMNVKYGDRETSGLGGSYRFDEGVGNIDLFLGSDPTFTPVIRDEKGRPINSANCEAGLIIPETLCAENDFTSGKGDNVEDKDADKENTQDNDVDSNVDEDQDNR